MAVHLKTRRRIKALLIGAFSLCLFGAIGIFLRQRQMDGRALRDRDQGYAALDQKQYFTAMHKIGPYLQRNPTDPDALFKYATARSHVEEPNGKHLIDAIGMYRRLLEVAPDHVQGRENLLEIYVSVGYISEILTETAGREDPPSLRARAIALANQGKDQESLKLLDRYSLAKPDDIRMQIFRCVLMQRSGSTAAQVLEHARKLQQSRPDSPAMELLVSFASSQAKDAAQSLEWVRKAAARPLTDQPSIEVAVELLDSHQKFEESLALIERAARGSDDPVFQRRAIARLYQSGRFEEVLLRLSDLEKQTPEPDAAHLSQQALALLALKRYDQAEAIAARLATRQGDFSSTAWAAVLAAVPREEQVPDDRKIILACREALKADSEHADLRLFLGDALARLGESEEAIREWFAAARAAPIWSAPLVRVTQAAMSMGQSTDLPELSQRLQALSSDDPDVLAVAAAALIRSAASVEAPEWTQARAVVDRILAIDPAHPSALMFKIRLLAAADRSPEASDVIKSALQKEPPLPAASYIALADASAGAELDLAQACLDRCQAVHGPSLALARARANGMIREKKNAQVLETFDAMRAAGAQSDALNWGLSRAALLDLLKDDRAGAEWAKLSDAFPDAAIVDRWIVVSEGAAKDHALMDKAIDRLEAVIGTDQGVFWRLARARFTLRESESIADAADRKKRIVEAAALVSDITRRYPQQLPARLLLADCLRRLDKPAETIEQLTVAARLAPRSLQVQLQLATLLNATNRFEDARTYLQQVERLLADRMRLAADPEGAQIATGVVEPSIASARRSLAALYAAQGDSNRAIALLEATATPEGGTDLDVMELRARRGELTDAQCQLLLAQPSLRAIEIVLENQRRQGRVAEAAATLALLEGAPAQPGQRELIRGLHFQRQRQFEPAVEQLRLAVAAMPTNAAASRELYKTLIILGDGDQAVAVLKNAAEQVPPEPRLAQAAGQSALIQDLARSVLLRPLLAALVESENDPEVVVAALKAAQEAIQSEKTIKQTAIALRPLADRDPTCVALQYLVIELYAGSGMPEEATAIATRLARLRSSDPLPARRAAEIYAAAGRWSESRSFAIQWRQRDGVNTLPADLLIARASLSLRGFAEALQQLEPYRRNPPADPAAAEQVTGLCARALAGLGRLDDAQALLEPGLDASAELRSSWVAIAQSVVPAPQNSQWLQRVTPKVPPDAASEQIELATAWIRLKDPDKASQQLVVATRALESSAKPTADSWVVLGSLKEQLADPMGAEMAYRKALSIHPNFNLAANNLAMLILKRTGDLNEALALASRAAAVKDDPYQPDFLDTVAQIQRAMGNRAAAEQSIRQALGLAPSNLSMRANLVQILLDQDKRPDARRELTDLQSRLRAAASPEPSLQARVDGFQAALQAAAQ